MRKIFSQTIEPENTNGSANGNAPTAEAPLGYNISAGGRCAPSQIKHKSARLPSWLKIKAGFDPEYVRVKKIVEDNGLHTVCGEAACPNIRECWGEGTATFMILGKFCTRGCNFCDVISGRPIGLDTDEPRRLAEGVSQLGLRQVVITSVTRDDLEDGGAFIFAETIRELRTDCVAILEP